MASQPNHPRLTAYLLLLFLALPLARAQNAPAPLPTPAERAIQAIDQLLAGQDWAAAARQARLLTEQTQPAPIRLQAFERLSIALAGLGEPQESAKTAQQAEIFFREQEKVRLAKSSGYFRNRSAFDGVRRYAVALLRKRQAAAESAGHAKQVVPVAVALARRFPAHPRRRMYALEAGEKLAVLGRENEAMPWFLAALDTGLDRSFGSKAKYSANQVQLDAVAKPPSLDLVTRALAGLAGLPSAEADRKTAGAKQSGPTPADQFQAALALTRQPDSQPAVVALETLLKTPAFGTRPFADIARLELARTHLRIGHALEASEVLSHIEPQRGGLLKRQTGLGRATAAQQHLLQGMVASLMLDRHAAADHFAAAADLGGDALHDTARSERARALELSGEWKTARKLYRKLAENSPAEWIRRYAGIAVARIDDRRVAPFPQGNLVTQLPDDRETHGDWHLGYGREHYVLCAHNHIADVTGGPRPETLPAFSTTDPKEPSRGWVSERKAKNPAMLWSPVRRARVSANRDDRGEQYPIGSGPDLLIKMPLPEGRHILSLYFVNDHLFYEANRHYTVEIRAGERLLALADVRDFGCGVYKRFLISSTRRIKVRIRRDASMNVLLHGVFLDAIPDLYPSPLPAARGTVAATARYKQCARRLQHRPASLLSHPSSLLPLARFLARQEGDGQEHYQAYRLFLAAGRPRSARRELDAFARDVSAQSLLSAADGIGKHMQRVDPFYSRRVPDWPSGTHILDVLLERWFAEHYAAVVPPDRERLEALRVLFSYDSHSTTSSARKRALSELLQYQPELLTHSALFSAGNRFRREGEYGTCALLMRRALKSNPDPFTEFRCAHTLLMIASHTDLPIGDIVPLYERALRAAEASGKGYLADSTHLIAAAAFAHHGEYEEALKYLKRSKTESASSLRESYEYRLKQKREENGGNE